MPDRENRPAATLEVAKLSILEKINKALADLGSTAKWKRAPAYLEGYEPLRGKTVVMVDDIVAVLENFLPNLMVATDGNALFVRYQGEPLKELINKILEANPDLVILDYHLSEQLKGAAVLRALMDQDFSGAAIGFSSDSQASKEFMAAGAMGTVDKGTDEPEVSVENIAKIIV